MTDPIGTRARIAAVVAAASVLGATAGAVVPALARVAPHHPDAGPCADPTAVLPTVQVEGQKPDCAIPPTDVPADSIADVLASSTADVPASSTADVPAPSTADVPAPSTADVAAPSTADVPATAPTTPTPLHAVQAPVTAPGAGVPAGLPSTKDTAAKPTGVSSHMPPPAGGAQGDGQPKVKSKPNSRPRSPVKSTARPGTSRQDPVSTAALPASWTSLTPLRLPAYGVKGFPIPPFLLPIYQAAAAQYAVPWEILASINEIETDFGRNAGVSSAGALGWMQFIPSSWKRWGTDGDADRRRDPRDPVDAIFAAARYLHGAGAQADLPKAIFAYNHAGWYVDRVVERAREFAGLDPMLVAALSSRALREDARQYRARGNPFAGDGAVQPGPGQALLLTKHQLSRIVLHSDDIEVYPGGRQDIAAGHIDRRVLATLVFLARSGLKPTVSCLMTGHSLLTTSGNISAHSYGHAVDISAINGVPIAGHQGADSITAKTLDRLVRMQGLQRPNQIISLMTVDGHDNTLSMGDHDDHIHVGFPRVPRAPKGARPADIVKFMRQR
ncbi:MAG: hypothetical protein QOJ89_4743 [bacterium]